MLGLTAIVEIIAGVLCIGRYGVAAFSIYLLAAVGFIGIELYSWRTFLLEGRDCAFGHGTPRLLLKIVLIDLGIAVLLELGTLIGAHTFSPIRLQDWHLGRMAIFFFFCLCVSMLFCEYGRKIDLELIKPSQSTLRGITPVITFVVAYFIVLILVRLLNTG